MGWCEVGERRGPQPVASGGRGGGGLRWAAAESVGLFVPGGFRKEGAKRGQIGAGGGRSRSQHGKLKLGLRAF